MRARGKGRRELFLSRFESSKKGPSLISFKTLHYDFVEHMRNIIICMYFDTDAPDSNQRCYFLQDPVMILLCDLESLCVLGHPGGLLGVPLEDGEEDDQEGGVGGVQDLSPYT